MTDKLPQDVQEAVEYMSGYISDEGLTDYAIRFNHDRNKYIKTLIHHTTTAQERITELEKENANNKFMRKEYFSERSQLSAEIIRLEASIADAEGMEKALEKAYPFIAYDDEGEVVKTRHLLEAADTIQKALAKWREGKEK